MGKKKKQSQGRGGGQKGQSQKAAKSKGGAEAVGEDLPEAGDDLVEETEQLEVGQDERDEEDGGESGLGSAREPEVSEKPGGQSNCHFSPPSKAKYVKK